MPAFQEVGLDGVLGISSLPWAQWNTGTCCSGSSWGSILGNIQDETRQDSDQPDLVEDPPAYCRQVGLDDLLEVLSKPVHFVILCFCDCRTDSMQEESFGDCLVQPSAQTRDSYGRLLRAMSSLIFFSYQVFMHTDKIPSHLQFSRLKPLSPLSLSSVSDGLVLYLSLWFFITFTWTCPCLSPVEWWGNFPVSIKQIVKKKKYDRSKSTAAKSDRFNKVKTGL